MLFCAVCSFCMLIALPAKSFVGRLSNQPVCLHIIHRDAVLCELSSMLTDIAWLPAMLDRYERMLLGISQARFLLAKLNPSATHQSDQGLTSEIIFTEDVSLEVIAACSCTTLCCYKMRHVCMGTVPNADLSALVVHDGQHNVSYAMQVFTQHLCRLAVQS